MLTSIRTSFEKGLPKYILIALMALLVLSFAVWGIGDLVRVGGRSTTALQIGKIELSAQDLQREFQREQRTFARELGRPATPQDVLAYRLDERVVSRLVNETLLDEQAKTMNLAIGEAAIAERIRSSESFKTTSGAFSRALFQQTINDLGFNESGYAQQETRFALRQHVAKAVTGAVNTSDIMLNAINLYQNEKRTAQYFTLGAGQVAPPTPATRQTLEAFYKANILKFSLPAMRKVTLIDASFDTLEPTLNISEAELAKFYDEVKIRLVPPETRALERLKFKTKEEAEAAAKSGKSFDTLANEANLKPEELDFGTFSKDQLIDKAVADAAFALKEGEVSAPLTTTFETVLVRVKKINPAAPPPMASILAPLKAELARQKLRDVTEDLRVAIDKETASGLPLSEVAKKLKLTPRVIDAIDAKGQNANGENLNLAGGAETLKAIFESGVNADNLAITLKDNSGYVWYEVNALIPARVRPLEEVKALAESLFLEDQVRNNIKAKAEEILKTSPSLEEAAKKLNLEVKTSESFTRNSTDNVFGVTAMKTLFEAKGDELTAVNGRDGLDFIIFKMSDKITIALNSSAQEMKALSQQIAQSYESDLLTQYTLYLQNKMPVRRNEANIKLGLGRNQIEP